MLTTTKLGSEITVEGMQYEGKDVVKKTFDLKQNKGERIRAHIGNDNKLTIESRPTQKLLICELDIPEKQYVHTKTEEKDENGEFIIETKEKELELEKVEMKEYLKQDEMK